MSAAEEFIRESTLTNELKYGFGEYSRYVISDRALPDARDGLKPVHRRIIYAMHELGLTHRSSFKKCARIVGEVTGKYHPHAGGTYESLVRLAQDWSLRYPLVEGQGNFGSIDGYPPAAMRYCVTGDTLVLTSEGLIPISSLSRFAETSAAKDMVHVLSGDSIYLLKFNEQKTQEHISGSEAEIDITILSHSLKKNRATKLFNSGVHETKKITTSSGYAISGSLNHPILCWVNTNTGPMLTWKTIQEIEKGDIVVLQRAGSLFPQNKRELSEFVQHMETDFVFPKELTEKLAYVLGFTIGTAKLSYPSGLTFKLKNMEQHEVLKQYLTESFPTIAIDKQRFNGLYEIHVLNNEFSEFMTNIGLDFSNTCRIPLPILESPKTVISKFLQGIFEGTGLFRNNSLTVLAKSKQLLQELKAVLLAFGITTGKVVADKPTESFHLSIESKSSLIKFKESIGFVSKENHERLTSLISCNSNDNHDFIPYLSDYLKHKYSSIEWICQQNLDTYESLISLSENLNDYLDLEDQVLIRYLSENYYLFDEIVLTEDTGLQTVYSIRVDSSCHSFTANGFINHNTEARLEKISQELLADLSPNVVEFVENFDGEETEPTVLPVRVPHLLLNGAKGIAVGMSSNIPPHHLGELLDGCVALIENPLISIDDLMEYITGPDFPTGGLIVGTKGIEQLYHTGKGSLRVRSRIHVEKPETHKVKETLLVVDEIPYFVNKTTLIEEIATLINENKIRGISNIRDLSKEKIRIEIEVEEGYSDDKSLKTIQAQLFNRTSLETLFHARILAFVYGKPRILTLKQALSIFLDFREQVVLKRSQEELEKVQARLHILEGLIIASNHIDDIIALIRASENRSEAQTNLMVKYGLSELQAKAVLDMTLARLARVEQNDLLDEAAKRRERAEFLLNIINNRSRRLEVIKEELIEIKNKYPDQRRTTILEYDDIGFKGDRALLHERNLLITSTSEGYVRSIDFETFKVQGRAGVGVIGVPLNEDERLLDFTVASNKDDLLLITEEGIIHKIPAFEVIEVQKRTKKGRKLHTYLPVNSLVRKIVPVKVDEFTKDKVLVTVTKNGMIKRTTLDKFKNIRKTGIKCLVFKEEGDVVADAFITDGDSYIFMATKFGNACVFEEKKARLTGRVAQGVIGMKMKDQDDEVISAFAVPKDKYDEAAVLTLTEKGYGKRTLLSKYRITNRGAYGVKNMKITEKNGDVTVSLYVPSDDRDVPISLISNSGKIIKVNVNTIRVMGRSTQGVRVMRLNKNERLVYASLIVDDSEAEMVEDDENDEIDIDDDVLEDEEDDDFEEDDFNDEDEEEL